MDKLWLGGVTASEVGVGGRSYGQIPEPGGSTGDWGGRTWSEAHARPLHAQGNEHLDTASHDTLLPIPGEGGRALTLRRGAAVGREATSVLVIGVAGS